MEIKIGYDYTNNKIITNDPKVINEAEKDILTRMLSYIQCNPDDLSIVANSSDYTTLQYKSIDIIRIKYTNNAKWIKIRMSINDMRNEKDNPLFALQNKKNESMWKCSINDIGKLYPFINRNIEQFDKVNK